MQDLGHGMLRQATSVDRIQERFALHAVALQDRCQRKEGFHGDNLARCVGRAGVANDHWNQVVENELPMIFDIFMGEYDHARTSPV